MKTIWVSPFKTKHKNQKRPFSLYILDRKEYILEQKKEVPKKPKKSKLSKGVSVHGSCKKIELFTTCAFLANQESKDRFLNNILERKEYFLDQKSEVSKSDVSKTS